MIVIKGWSISHEYRLRELGFFNQEKRNFWNVCGNLIDMYERTYLKYRKLPLSIIILLWGWSNWNRNFRDGLSLIGHSHEQSVLVHPVVRGHAGRWMSWKGGPEAPSTLTVLWFSLLNCLSWCDSGPFNCWVLQIFIGVNLKRRWGEEFTWKVFVMLELSLINYKFCRLCLQNSFYSCSCTTLHLVLVTANLQTTLLQTPTADAAQQCG